MFNFNRKPLAQRDSERGQIIVILAGAMVGLLVAAGLATDAGVLFMRRAQLDRAVDAAALSGVTQLTSSTNATTALRSANTRGQQLLALNEIFVANDPPDDLAECLDESDPNYDAFWSNHEYCGEQQPGTIVGAMRYHIEVRWQSETYFMKLMGFEEVPLRSQATAEYMPLVDMYASETEFNVLNSSNAAIFGPEQQCTSMGDPYTPTNSQWYDELNGVYTYRVRVPETYMTDEGHDSLRIEIFDPDTRNSDTTSFQMYNTESTGITDTDGGNCGGSRSDPCLYGYNLDQAGENEYWFVRLDENRTPSCSTPSYTKAYNTRTLYRLYYLQQQTDGSLKEVDLAFYVGKTDETGRTPLSSYTGTDEVAEALATDMHWVSPGASDAERMPAFTFFDLYGYGDNATVLAQQEPRTYIENCSTFSQNNQNLSAGPGDTCSPTTNGDFIIDLLNETPGIYIDPSTGSRDIYLEVIGLEGSSENGFALWAGPPRTAGANYAVPSNINFRHIYLLSQRDSNPDIYSPDGAAVYGLGHLPMNSNTTHRVDIPLAYLGPEFAGQTINLDLFDADSGTYPPIAFFFDTIPRSDWMACYDDGSASSNDCDRPLPDGPGGSEDFFRGPDQLNINGTWASYDFVVPGETPGSSGADNIPFYGGRLYVSYVGGNHDTYGWKMTIEGRPFLVQ